MSEKPLQADDEIDLFQLFLTLWEGKWLISIFVTMSIFFGVGLTQLLPKEYNVKAPYSVYYFFEKGLVEDILREVVGSDWRKESNQEIGDYLTLETATETPLNAEEYWQIFLLAEKEVVDILLTQIKIDLSIIQNFEEPLLNTNSAAEQTLAAIRNIQQIEQVGAKPVSFEPPLVYLAQPKTPLIISLSLVLGCFLGMTFVLVRKAIISCTSAEI